MLKKPLSRDLRGTPIYQETQALLLTLRRPGTGQISDATEVHASSRGNQVVFSASLLDALEGEPPTRIGMADLATGETRVLTDGPHVDRLPKFSPDDRHIAFLSDRKQPGNFQLFLLDPLRESVRPTPRVEGWVEYLHWSPDGRRILLGVAGHGADISGGQGATTTAQLTEELPSWMPRIETGDEPFRWRSLWIYDLSTGRAERVACDDNVWEAAWCGGREIVAIVSPGPGEGLWYSARAVLLELETGRRRDLYVPQDQIAWPAASPSGRHIALVEAVCSDRWIVAGDLYIFEAGTDARRKVDTRGVDISCTEWRSERSLLLAGHRGFETVIGVYDAEDHLFSEVWRSSEICTGGFHVTVSGLNDTGDCVLVGESFLRAPEIAVIQQGQYRAVKSLDLGYTQEANAVRAPERVVWSAPDGLELQGWLLRPHGEGPYPLVMNAHGGPVGQWHPLWLGRNSRGIPLLILIKHGYAVFLPNPRGSSGRGQDFARQVLGEMGGPDTLDYISGVDHLVKGGIADPRRLGVMGVSYGGFMTSWLITQDMRFAAAIPIAPATNHVTSHLLSNIPEFVELFLGDKYKSPNGKYHSRSPIMHAHKARTPTLNICGALDRCSPPQDAAQFHNALMQSGVESVLITYPEEGHGVRRLPAVIDYVSRIVAWFETFMPAQETQC